MGPPDDRVAIAPDLPRAERLRRILDRDGHECVWCRRPLASEAVTRLRGSGHRLASLEHVIPRLKGGPAWPENEVAACRACNRTRGHTAPVDWLRECEARGLEPNRAVVEGSLRALERAIAERGGARRARPYLDAQLRRI